jgi:hypothetical protein
MQQHITNNIRTYVHTLPTLADQPRLFSTGELFDLEALSRTCHELNRYTFFVTSMPLNMPGGVSSPPNAMAIF